MKKFLKALILIIIVIILCFIIFNYKSEIETLFSAAKIEINNYFEIDEEPIYTEKQIEDILLADDKEVTGEYIGKLDTYYYEQLDVYSKLIYKTILNNIDQVRAGNAEIELSNSLSNIMKQNNGKEKINIAFQNAWSAFRLDHPEIFDINIKNVYLTTKTTTIGNKTKYEFYLNSKEEKDLKSINNTKNVVEQKEQEVIKGLNNSNNATKILGVHNWLIDNLQYDVTMQKENNSNIYGALIEKNVVCEGYAKAFKYILDDLEIPCVIICGEVVDEDGNSQKHAWNEVYLNGKWYAIDVTWDDPIIIGGGKITNELRYKYFLKGATDINKNHFQNGKMSDDESEIEFKYPELSTENYKKIN